MTLRALVFRYALFAVIATLANLAAQRLVLSNWTAELAVVPAIAVGTIVGLMVKYALDKRWIFFDETRGVKAQGAQFTLYAGTGVFTTLIFWGAEGGFWYLWRTEMMRELGAVLGLTVGYVIKYNLDRRFVFTDQRLAAEARAESHP